MFRKLHFGRKRSDGSSNELSVQSSTSSIRSPSPTPSQAPASRVHSDNNEEELGIQRSPTSNSAESLGTHKQGDIDPGSLGLNVIYNPQNGHKVDIVFIHGLGGTSKGTWSKSKDPELFWPLTFLALEPDLCLARIMTFGYNAAFRKAGGIGVSILDFAKDLLFDLRYGQDQNKQDLGMGKVPLIFIVHSMGGLIVKEAYMQGQNDPEFEGIIKAIVAITFLATPHRGTNLAQTLNRILQSTMVTTPKQYVAELVQNSLTLQKLNEQFRHVAPKLDITSFYETLPTPIGLRNARVMVLEKDSSVLGYPGETSKALNANHQEICKYDSPSDPNYVAVRNILKSIVSKIVASGSPVEPKASTREAALKLRSLLGITSLPAVDYSFFRDQWVQGTCDWIFEDSNFLDWRHDTVHGSRIIWLRGGPASGKSVMASFIINHLVESGAPCQYFFVRFGDRQKRTLNHLLRSMAYQVAQTNPRFLKRILEFSEEAAQLQGASPRAIWDQIFRSILFKMKHEDPVFWVIDGLDESEDPRTLIKLLSDLAGSAIPIKVLLIGRDTSEMREWINRLAPSLKTSVIDVAGDKSVGDLRSFVTQELRFLASADYRTIIIDRIIQGSQNNFLWVRLAVEKINRCRREVDVEQALQQLPAGMEDLYDRMASVVVQHASPTDRELAITILQYLTRCFRVLTLAELAYALNEDVVGMFDLERTVVDLCGGFVTVDISGNVTMIHQTAREYLSTRNDQLLRIDKGVAHKAIFLSCMRCLMTIGLRTKVSHGQVPEFLNYAATFWSNHLVAASDGLDDLVAVLKQFLTGTWILTWMDYLARNDKLREIITTSKHLSKLASRRKALHSRIESFESHRTIEVELLESWSIDLIKVVGKFGNIMRRNPDAIYKLIPPFCPRSSSIWQYFGKLESKNIIVSGLSAQTWDDSLARIPLGDNVLASSIQASGSQVAILTSSGILRLYDASTFEQSPASPLQHKERLYRFHINSSASLVATYGYRTVKVWEVSTGKCKLSIANLESKPRPLAMLFAKGNNMLYVAYDDRKIRAVSINEETPRWQTVANLEEPELEGHFLNASNFMAFNETGSMIAVAYRGHPLSAWETEGPTHIGHCWRKRDVVARGEVIDAAWIPHHPEIVGVYIEGVLFRWNPYSSDVEELAVGASRISMSRDGNVVATGDGKGTIKIFATWTFDLLYQLPSQDTVFGIAFSPDVHRFYDIRGNYANVWEPNALIKFAEETGTLTDTDSESDFSSISASRGIYKQIDSITALAFMPSGKYYLSGTERGDIRLHDVKTGDITVIRSPKSFLSIEKIACSEDGKMFCFYDSSRKLVLMSLSTQDGATAAAVRADISMRNIVGGPIVQILFDQKNGKMLLQAETSVHIIALETCEVIRSQKLELGRRVFICHPHDQSLLLMLEDTTIGVLGWDLQEFSTHEYGEFLENKGLEPNKSLNVAAPEQAMLTQDKKKLLVVFSGRNTADRQAKSIIYFETTNLFTTRTSKPASSTSILLRPVILDAQNSSKILRPLGLLSRDRLIFLSKSFAICCWQIPSAVVKEMFYLPGDWISRDTLELCSMWNTEKTLLCPRNGEVAVVKCSTLI